MKQLDPVVSAYMKKIGAKGGRAGRGTKLRAALNSKAGLAGWAKRRAQQRPDFELIWRPGSLVIRPVPSNNLLNGLGCYDRKSRDGAFEGCWLNLFEVSGSELRTYPGFLSRLVASIEEAGFVVKTAIDANAVVPARVMPKNYQNSRSGSLVRRLLVSSPGAAAVVDNGEIPDVVVRLVRAFPKAATAIVTSSLKEAARIYMALVNKVNGNRSLGMLAGSHADSGDVTVMMSHYLREGVISPPSIQLLIFVNPPRKGLRWLTELHEFGNAVKFAVMCPKAYPAWQRTLIEGTFGPITIGGNCVSEIVSLGTAAGPGDGAK